MTQAKYPDLSGGSATSHNRQRTVPRYSFVATTELIDCASATHLSGRVSEISRQGCYVDILNALPVGTSLNVLISRDQGTFVTKGKIIYVQDQLQVLDSWLAEFPSNIAP
jgi:hypothetical protein